MVKAISVSLSDPRLSVFFHSRRERRASSPQTDGGSNSVRFSSKIKIESRLVFLPGRWTTFVEGYRV